MEGFHLFQEKIKGEVGKIKSSDPQILFLQSESLSGWDISELDISGNRYLEAYNCECEEEYYELAPFVNFSIEYSALNSDIRLHIDDFRDVMANFNNDLELEGKQTIIMFYD